MGNWLDEGTRCIMQGIQLSRPVATGAPYPRWRGWAPVSRSGGDSLAVVVLVALATFHIWRQVIPVSEYFYGDWVTFFIPMFGHLGERIRAGDIPGWNPAQFAGAPFAADPESGWGQLLAMLWFSMLPVEPALIAYLVSTMLLASLGTYSLARVLGLGALASFAAGASYGAGWLLEYGACCPPYVMVAAWLPTTVLAVELTVRSVAWRSRLLWSMGAGFGAAQLVTGFLGQGAYYALLVVGGYFAFRCLVAPVIRVPWRARLWNLLRIGAPIGFAGFGFAAMSLLPALEYIGRTNLAGANYTQTGVWEYTNQGYQPLQVVFRLFGGYAFGLWEYFGITAIILAVLAPLVAWNWTPLPYFLFIAVAAPILTLREQTPLHSLLYILLPGFEQLHTHAPSRILIVALLPTVLLAAATLDRLPRFRPRLPQDVILVALPGMVLFLFAQLGPARLLTSTVLAAAAATTILVALHMVLPLTRARHWVSLALVLALWLDPAGRLAIAGHERQIKVEVSVNSLLSSGPGGNGAAQFLAEGPAGSRRFASYSPKRLPDSATMDESRPFEFSYLDDARSAEADALLLQNRATLYGLEDAQGYNPVQIERYVTFIDAMNGHRQEYHERVLYPPALYSPLLDLLAIRYFVMDPAEVPGAGGLSTEPVVVFRDQESVVIERASSLPRSWIVHAAQHVAPGEALPRLVSGTVDPRQVVVLESPPPPLGDPAPGKVSTAELVVYEPDRMVVEVDAAAPGLLVLSEIFDPGWTATVDGAATEVLIANHTFRAVPVGAGAQTVELTYQPEVLMLGLLITAATALGVIGFAVVVWFGNGRRARSPKRRTSLDSGG